VEASGGERSKKRIKVIEPEIKLENYKVEDLNLENFSIDADIPTIKCNPLQISLLSVV